MRGCLLVKLFVSKGVSSKCPKYPKISLHDSFRKYSVITFKAWGASWGKMLGVIQLKPFSEYSGVPRPWLSGDAPQSWLPLWGGGGDAVGGGGGGVTSSDGRRGVQARSCHRHPVGSSSPSIWEKNTWCHQRDADWIQMWLSPSFPCI